jgi:hypothetical protein
MGLAWLEPSWVRRVSCHLGSYFPLTEITGEVTPEEQVTILSDAVRDSMEDWRR